MIDEEVAKTMLCAFAKDFSGNVGNCAGSGCMVWKPGERFSETITVRALYGDARPNFELTQNEREQRQATYLAWEAEGWLRPPSAMYEDTDDWGEERVALVRGRVPTGECLKAKRLLGSAS